MLEKIRQILRTHSKTFYATAPYVKKVEVIDQHMVSITLKKEFKDEVFKLINQYNKSLITDGLDAKVIHESSEKFKKQLFGRY